MRLFFVLAALLAVATTVQATSLTGSSWAEPAEITYNYDEFQKDENGDYIRDSDGAYVRVPTTFMAYWDIQLECTPGTGPNGPFELFAGNTGEFASTDPETGEKVVIFDLEPKEFMAEWTGSQTSGMWSSSGSKEITIENEQAWSYGHTTTYQWVSTFDNVIPTECRGDGLEGSLDFQNHTIIMPALDFSNDDGTDATPKRTPAPMLWTLPVLAWMARRAA